MINAISAKNDDDQKVDWPNFPWRNKKLKAAATQNGITGSSAHEKILGETFIFSFVGKQMIG